MPKHIMGNINSKAAIECFANNINTLFEMNLLAEAMQFAIDAAAWCQAHTLKGAADMFMTDAAVIEGRMH